MFEQPDDLARECTVLDGLLTGMSDADLARPTLFAGWTVNQIVGHLLVWNGAALRSLESTERFREFHGRMIGADGVKKSISAFEAELLAGLAGQALVDAWRESWTELVARTRHEDPKRRVAWAGPDMSVRSSVTARLMETWAHAQAIYDLLGLDRTSDDGIGNIAVLGVNTYGWTFVNRGEQPPEPKPYVELIAPSGRVWAYGEPNDAERITGSAEQFCQVVTQCRNVADTALTVQGPNASRWMAIAQCFAGAPTDPPAPGVRHKQA